MPAASEHHHGSTAPPASSAKVELGRFVAAARASGATATDDEIAAVAGAVLDDYAAPGRGYHNAAHLAEVLQFLDALGSDEPAVELAAWFHDVVYTGLPGQDESASAARATRNLIDLGVRDEAALRVSSLVLMTIDHIAPDGDLGAALLCDADLAILATEPARYAEYVAGVRTDYAHVPDDVFAAGRAVVLRQLLRRASTDPGRDGPLFRTDRASQWTHLAVANLTAELAELEST